MADNNWSRWYREGTVKVVNGSKTVLGTDTYWLSAGLHAGDIFSLDGVTDYEIDTVTSNTQLTLRTAYAGSTSEGESYSIVRNFTATLPAEIAAKTAGLIGDFIKYIDTDMQSIHGKSAYELAKSNGYVGTESQWLESLSAYGVAKTNGYTGTLSEWLSSLKGDSAYQVAVSGGYSGTQAEWLESLKAAGEWSTLDVRTKWQKDIASINGAGPHNALVRGKSLGSEFTDAQKAAISAGTFDDMYLGDWWEVNGRKWYIIGFNYFLLGEDYNVHPGWPAWWNTPNNSHVKYGKGKNHVVLMTFIQAYPSDDDAAYQYWGKNEVPTAYIDSNYYLNVRPILKGELEDVFSADLMFHWLDQSYTCNDSGLPSGYTDLEGICEIATAYMWMGHEDSRATSYGRQWMNYQPFPLLKLAPEFYNAALERGYKANTVMLRDLSLTVPMRVLSLLQDPRTPSVNESWSPTYFANGSRHYPVVAAVMGSTGWQAH